MMYAMIAISDLVFSLPPHRDSAAFLPPDQMYKYLDHEGGDLNHSPVVS
jgi:hypothetical protein